MLIAIHNRSDAYTDRWGARCESEGIPYKRVNCLDTAIIRQLDGVDGLLWRWLHSVPEDKLVARQVIAAAECAGVLVYPNSTTSWHFDDKIAQKYLLEAIGAPLIPTHVFVDRNQAMDWIASAGFPQVFKLRCGAGSSNVQLVKTPQQAARICRRMFGKGRAPRDTYFSDFRKKIRVTKDFRRFAEKAKRAPQILASAIRRRARLPIEQGYVYFQDYLPGNAFDTRITIVGSRAFAYRRMNRPGDFRASGSGNPNYDMSAIDKRCIPIAFDITDKLNARSLAFDFLYNAAGELQIGEISYAFVDYMIHDCPGHWDRAMNWHEGHAWPQDVIFDDFLAAIERRRVGKTTQNGD